MSSKRASGRAAIVARVRRNQFARVLHDAPYALTLDTGILSVGACVERIVALL